MNTSDQLFAVKAIEASFSVLSHSFVHNFHSGVLERQINEGFTIIIPWNQYFQEIRNLRFYIIRWLLSNWVLFFLSLMIGVFLSEMKKNVEDKTGGFYFLFFISATH